MKNYFYPLIKKKKNRMFDGKVQNVNSEWLVGIFYVSFDMSAPSLQPAPGSVPTKDQEEKFSEQHDRVHALFKRQLTVPLQG